MPSLMPYMEDSVPKRLVDGDAIAKSKKLKEVPEWMRAEFALLLTLSLANGSFECDPETIWAELYAFNRPSMSLNKVQEMITEFERVKMLFRWQSVGKVWGTWIGQTKSGRLPKPSEQERHTRGAEIPAQKLAKWLSPTGRLSRDVVAATSRLGLGFGSGAGVGVGLSESDSAKGDGDGTGSGTSERDRDDKHPLHQQDQNQSGEQGDSDEDWLRLVAQELMGHLGKVWPKGTKPNGISPEDYKKYPLYDHDLWRKWTNDARPLLEMFRTKEDRSALSAIMLWAFGRYDLFGEKGDDFWRSKTSNMKALVTHLEKGGLMTQFRFAMNQPEFWTRHYCLGSPSGDNPPCPWPLGIGAFIQPQADCPIRTVDVYLRHRMDDGHVSEEFTRHYDMWRTGYDILISRDASSADKPFGKDQGDWVMSVAPDSRNCLKCNITPCRNPTSDYCQSCWDEKQENA